MVIAFVFAVVLTEALTELIIGAELLEPVKIRIMRLGKFFETLLTCGYCMSVWVGVGMAYLFRLRIGLPVAGWVEPLILGLFLHRASNLWHDTLGWVKRMKYPPPPSREQ